MRTIRRTSLVACLALSALAAVDVFAAPVLCANKKGGVFARPTCKARETAVDVASLVPIPTKPAVGVRVVAARNISVPYNVIVPVPFDAVDFDTDAFFKPLSSITTLIAPRDGVYTITANVEWDRRTGGGSISGYVGAEIDKTPGGTSERTLALVSTPYQNTFGGRASPPWSGSSRARASSSTSSTRRA